MLTLYPQVYKQANMFIMLTLYPQVYKQANMFIMFSVCISKPGETVTQYKLYVKTNTQDLILNYYAPQAGPNTDSIL